MHQIINLLTKVAERYAPSRVLSFDQGHVFKAMQIMEEKKKTSRKALMYDLGLGEGVVKTMVKHMKMNRLVENSNAGMWLTPRGKIMYLKLRTVIAGEIDIPKCSVALGKFNHAVLVRGFAYTVKTGIEQRDIAIRHGAIGATTLVFKDDKLMMPGKNLDSLRKEPKICELVITSLKPENEDIIIIVSADDKRTAEMAAKDTALQIISDHERHF
jgi:hypothetical protein